MEKKNLILIHGALGDGSQLFQLANVCSDQFEVHVITLGGHGNQPLANELFSIAGFSEEVIGYMDLKGISSALFFGYSMGGYIGLFMSLNHPGRVEKLITLGTKLDWSPDTAAKESAMLNPEIMEQKIPAFVKALDAKHSAAGWRKVVTETASMMTGLGRNPITEDQFRKINIPVLLMVGSNDKMVSVTETEKVTRFIPNAKMKVLPEVPHPVEQVDPAALEREISKFSVDHL